MNFFPFHIGDYAFHTRHLTPMEDLAYRRTLDLYYSRDGELPETGVARLIGLPECAAEVATVLDEFFPNGKNKRAEEEIERMRQKQDNARASVAKRTAHASVTQASREHHASDIEASTTNNQEPRTNTSEEIAASPLVDAAQAARPSPEPFDGLNAEALNGKAVVSLSAAWELPESWGVDAVALGFKPGEALHEGEKFRQFWTAGRGAGKRRTVKGWRQAWSNWLGKAAERTR